MLTNSPLARCLRDGKQRSICGVPGHGYAKGRALSPAQPARECALAMRKAPCGGTARVGPNSAPGRAASHRAFHHMRRSAPGLRGHLLRRLRARVPARVLVQYPVSLPQLPPEARAPVRRMGRAERARARGTPAVRVHAAAAPATDFRARGERAKALKAQDPATKSARYALIPRRCLPA